MAINRPTLGGMDGGRPPDREGMPCQYEKVCYALAICGGALTVGGVTEAKAQDMQTFLNNLNRQVGTAYQHYYAGRNIYDSVPVEQRLDYRCAMGDGQACWLHQQQLNNANAYMARHYRSLGY
jgi:hypothetical protein